MREEDPVDPSSGSQSSLFGGLEECLRREDFVDRLGDRALEEHLRANMLGLTARPVTLGRWEIRREVARGAMGAVFHAFDPKLQREVALKILLDPDDDERHVRRARMEAEARAMARLPHHANVVQIHDFHPGGVGETGLREPSFLVMDYVVGSTLELWSRSQPRSWLEIVEKFTLAAKGLAHIHAHDLVHRDIKPANILVREDGAVLVGDFGLVADHAVTLATDVENSPGYGGAGEGDETTKTVEMTEVYGGEEQIPGPFATRLTEDGACLGTLAYMAPEQLRDGQTSPRSDQFSFFVALYQALYSELPFAGATPVGRLAAIERGLPRPGRGTLGVPRWLRRMLIKGLAVDPVERFEDMGAVVEALEDRVRPLIERTSRGLVGFLGVGLVLVTGLLIMRAGDPCAEALDLPFWRPLPRVFAGVGFIESGEPGADAAWSRFASTGEQFMDQWRGMKAEACRAIEAPSNDQELALARSRDACLDESSALLQAFVERYQSASRDDVRYSENAAYELLESLRECGGDRFVRHASGDSKSQVDFASVRRLLAQALAHEVSGDLGLAADKGRAALASVQGASVGGVEARAHFRLGRVLSLLEQTEEGLVHLDAALKLANASQRSDIAADAVIELIKIMTLGREELRKAEVYANMIDSLVEGISAEEPRRAALAEEAKGILAAAQGDYTKAARHHRLGLQLRQRTEGIPPGDLIRSHINLANALSELRGDTEALAAARASYEEALRMSEKLSATHPLRVDARRTYGAFLREQGELDAAQRMSERALLDAQALYGEMSASAARIHTHLGAVSAEREDPETTRRHVDAALAYYDSVLAPTGVNSDQIMALQLLADVELQEGRVDAALATYQRAIAVLEKSPDHRLAEAETRGFLGELLVDEERYSEALPHLERAREGLTGAGAKATSDEDLVFLVAALAAAQTAAGDASAGELTAAEAEGLARSFDLSEDPTIRARLERAHSPSTTSR